MNENEKIVSNEPENIDTDYIDAINELKANTVDKGSYDRLRAENQKLLASLISGNKVEVPEPEVKYDPNELRKKLFNRDGNMTNLEYIDTALKLRKTVMDAGERDPFLSVGSKVTDTAEQHETAERVANILQECVDFANGDSGIFSAELQRRTIDVMPAKRGR